VAARGAVAWTERVYLLPRWSHLYHRAKTAGAYPSEASLGDHTGLGLTLHFRPWPGKSPLYADLSASTRGYERVRAGLSRGPADFEYRHDWRPADEYFGIGLHSLADLGSDYALRSERLRVTLAAPWRPGGAPRRASAAVWIGMRSNVMSRGRERDEPSIEENFPVLPGPALGVPVEHLVYGAGATLDSRHGAPHWTGGVHAHVEVQRFDEPVPGLEVLSGVAGVPFTRFEFSGETGLSFMREPRTVRIGVRAAGLRGGGDRVLVSDLPSLGGAAGLAGFDAGRFRDRNSLVARISYVFPLLWRAEIDAHFEAGGVYADLAEDPKLRTLATSCGITLRPRSREAPLAQFGLDASRDGARFVFALGGE
jgi:hypothetical protein